MEEFLMSYTLIFEIENTRQGYIRCTKTIEQILSSEYNEKIDDFAVVKAKNSTMPANKYDEPLKGTDLSSSFYTVDPSEFSMNFKKYLKNPKFHVRIHSGDEINLEGFHYLALMIEKLADLIQSKRLSFFLVPRSSSIYPYEKNGLIDTELYEIASMHLRALIGEGKKGVIYGVSCQTINDGNIVKALDFKIKSKGEDSFPVVIFDGNIEYEQKNDNIYLGSEKVGNASLRNRDIPFKSINNYSLLFKKGVVLQYLTLAAQLKKNQRFGFATHENPNIALCDYIFEAAYGIFMNKSTAINLSTEEILSYLKEEFKDTDIFSFAIFSFILNLSDLSFDDDFSLRNKLKNCYLLSHKISFGIEQIIQNALQHSSQKICAVSFFKDLDNLIIIISDVGNSTILDTFKENLISENDFLLKEANEDPLLKTLSKNIGFYKKSSLTDTVDGLSLKYLFNDFDNIDNETATLENWWNFRQTDSSAHIGMALFADAITKCGGNFSLASSCDYCADTNDKRKFYTTYDLKDSKKVEKFPGTEYIISLPTLAKENREISNIVQLNNTNYIENYESFATFVDYEIKELFYTIDKEYSKQLKSKIKTSGSKDALNKFKLQTIWTNYWLNIFEHIDLSENKIYYIDYSPVGPRQRFLENNYARETVIKGLIDALGVFCSKNGNNKLYIAIVNADSYFIDLFEEISLSLSLKVFPTNLQLFISDKDEDKQIHLIGQNYGQAIQNAYLLSLENYYNSYDGSVYYNVDNIMAPFYNIMRKERNKQEKKEPEKTKPIKVVPFSGILPSKHNDKNMFFSKISIIANKDMIQDNGYKLTHNHTRLGNKVHIDSFYEMSHLFHRTVVANHVAFYIIRDLKTEGRLDLCKDQILFYGYASYSQAILMSLTKILEFYRKDSQDKLSYSIYQYNLQYEADPKDIKIYLSNPNLENSSEKINVIQIVPISSTLTTFAKMWKKLKQEHNFLGELLLNKNYTVFWVRDDLKSARAKNETGKELNVSKIEYKYFNLDENDRIVSKFSALSDMNIIDRILTGSTRWETPETCSQCFPQDDLLKEKPIIETDPTSTVPSQQIYSSKSVEKKSKTSLCALDKNSREKYAKLYGNVFYGHFKRGKNHYQYFIDTQTYFATVSSQVKKWLESLRKTDEKYKANLPTIDIIFSPSHNTNVGFSQYVNAYYFHGGAEIISINEDKEFDSNFNCEYAMLKSTIQNLVDNYFLATGAKDGHIMSKYGYRPVRFIFVDDNIITGDSFRKASKLLQALLPKEIIENYGTNVFDKCFVLINRMSQGSKNSYILPKENFYAFCEINISNMRRYGDSCACCKLKNQVNDLRTRSATKYSYNYWTQKRAALQEKTFETIEKEASLEEKNKAYLRLMYSHIVREFIADEINNTSGIFNRLLMLLDFFSGNAQTNSYDKDLLDYLESYLSILPIGYHDAVLSFNKDSVVSIIKIVSRPFFSYNQNIKQAVLQFLIVLCETIISPKNDLDMAINFSADAVKISQKIKKIFLTPLDLLEFLQDVILDAFADLHSTYLLRAQTLCKIIKYTNSLFRQDNPLIHEEKYLKDFYLHYAVCVQRLVNESSDETRNLRMEYFLISAVDAFSEQYDYKYNKDFGATFYDKFIKRQELKCLNEKIKKAFGYFCTEVYLNNGRILYEGIEKLCNGESKTQDEEDSDNYFAERSKIFRRLDNDWAAMDLQKFDLQKQKFAEVELYKLLNNQVDFNGNGKNGSIIEKRYRELLMRIQNVIKAKYDFKSEEIHIALLTMSEAKDNISAPNQIQKLEMVQKLIEYNGNASSEEKELLDSNSKYIIKKRLSSMLSDSDFNELGYKIVFADNSKEYCLFEQSGISESYDRIKEGNHRKPYFILSFHNNADNNKENSPKAIVPVYLYLSVWVKGDNTYKQREIRPLLIMRDILTYRNKIVNYLEEDFTNDVMQRYSNKRATEAILKNEKVMSHTPMDQDKAELIHLLSKKDPTYSEDEINSIKGWAIARNYCNTMIARLYNRVLRNIDKPFSEIITEYQHINRETYKLYIQSNGKDNDGKNIPLANISQILPGGQNADDVVYQLFDQIIEFKSADSLEFFSAYSYKHENNQYAYNLDYVKSIIYRICFDAMRFSYGSGCEKNDFVARVANHYRALKRKQYKKQHPNNKWLIKEEHKICYMEFHYEQSPSQNFDWLVIKNELYKPSENHIEYLKKKLEDPLDFTDGHMSLITTKEYFAKMLDEGDVPLLNDMYDYDTHEEEKSYFVTKLPIIKKGEIPNEDHLD